MTKRYGVFIGAVKLLTPPRPVDAGYENTKDSTLAKDYVALAAAPAADTISLGFFGWESQVNPKSYVDFDALGAATTLSVGDAGHPTAMVNAQDTHTAAGSVTLGANLSKDLWYAPLWKALGYASLAAAQAVGQSCELLATIGGGAATGNVAWHLSGQKRI